MEKTLRNVPILIFAEKQLSLYANAVAARMHQIEQAVA